MSVRPLNKRFALIVALYNCRKRDYKQMVINCPLTKPAQTLFELCPHLYIYNT